MGLTIYQVDAFTDQAFRGGVIRVRVGDKRVFIGGKAVTVLRAELHE